MGESEGDAAEQAHEAEAKEWAVEIAGKTLDRPVPTIVAQTYYREFDPSYARPVAVGCSDGNVWVIKGCQVEGLALFNDHAAALLAQLIGAPVPETTIVMMTDALRAVEPRVAHIPAGPCHASRFMHCHSDRATVLHASEPENRRRFALLSILYGWMYAGDHQQIYPNDPPYLVVSVDHGHFVGDGGPRWTPALLRVRGPARPDIALLHGAGLRQQDLEEAGRTLLHVTNSSVSEIAAAPPDRWNVSEAERVAFGMYIWRRRSELLAALNIIAPLDAAPQAEA